MTQGQTTTSSIDRAAALPPRADHVFVSPHLDDVALSCGGLVRRLTAAGEDVLVVTVVTAEAPRQRPLSRLARRHHLSWDLGDAPFSVRRDEDVAAVETLGAHPYHLGLLDALYRYDESGAPFYRRNICGVQPDRADLATYEPLVREALQRTLDEHAAPNARVYCPLTVGAHVDHVIVRRAVESIVPADRITYYEDFPYAGKVAQLHPSLVRNDNTGHERWVDDTIVLTPDEVDARIAATACYASQYPPLFPTTLSMVRGILRARLPGGRQLIGPTTRADKAYPHMERKLRAYVARVGGERYWRPADERRDPATAAA